MTDFGVAGEKRQVSQYAILQELSKWRRRVIELRSTVVTVARLSVAIYREKEP